MQELEKEWGWNGDLADPDLHFYCRFSTRACNVLNALAKQGVTAHTLTTRKLKIQRTCGKKTVNEITNGLKTCSVYLTEVDEIIANSPSNVFVSLLTALSDYHQGLEESPGTPLEDTNRHALWSIAARSAARWIQEEYEKTLDK